MTPSVINFENYLKQVIEDASLESFIPEILQGFNPLYLSKNSFFVEEGKVCPYFCFIEGGILQHYILSSGEEKTTYLALKNSCTSALHSFKNELASRKSIKAISDCNLWVIDLPGYLYLMQENLAFQKFYAQLIENQIYRIDDYRIDLLTLTPEERYLKLLANDPVLLQRVPLRYLASFLGISSRHMSRIRKNSI